MKNKETKESAPKSVREQVQPYYVVRHLEPGERLAALESERIHLATRAEVIRVEGKVDVLNARFDGVDARLNGMDARLDGIDTRLNGIDTRLNRIDARLDGMDTRLGRLEGKMDVQIAVNEKSEKMMRWVLGLIVTLLVVVVASLITGPVG